MQMSAQPVSSSTSSSSSTFDSLRARGIDGGRRSRAAIVSASSGVSRDGSTSCGGGTARGAGGQQPPVDKAMHGGHANGTVAHMLVDVSGHVVLAPLVGGQPIHRHVTAQLSSVMGPRQRVQQRGFAAA